MNQLRRKYQYNDEIYKLSLPLGNEFHIDLLWLARYTIQNKEGWECLIHSQPSLFIVMLSDYRPNDCK